MPARPNAAAGAAIFVAFAHAYFLSALLRSITATLAPVFSRELGLEAGDLGLLAGAYFLGFAALQLPLGAALDHFGPKRVLVALLALAVLGCVAFARADGLTALFVSRLLIGMGLSACLMAPLTCYRRLFDPATQLRANSWMLMTGSLGMLASTLPVQWLLPLLGWRGVFLGLAALLVVAMAVVLGVVPPDPKPGAAPAQGTFRGYRDVVVHPAFVRCVPMGFFIYGGLIAMQALWAGPWLTRVAGRSPEEAAQGLFLINGCMLLAFLAWGFLMPRLVARGVSAQQLMLRGLPLPVLVLGAIVLWPAPAGAAAWALWCVSCTFVSLSQPAIGQAFEQALAGRALSAYNLVIFAGVFAVQWGIGLLIDAARASGLDEPMAFRVAFGAWGSLCLLSYLWYAWPLRRAS